MEYNIIPCFNKIVLPNRGYFKKGDSGEAISVIASFLACNFMGYETKIKVPINDMLGNYFGKSLKAWIKEFQKQNNLETSGNIDSKTLDKIREYGFTL